MLNQTLHSIECFSNAKDTRFLDVTHEINLKLNPYLEQADFCTRIAGDDVTACLDPYFKQKHINLADILYFFTDVKYGSNDERRIVPRLWLSQSTEKYPTLSLDYTSFGDISRTDARITIENFPVTQKLYHYTGIVNKVTDNPNNTKESIGGTITVYIPPALNAALSEIASTVAHNRASDRTAFILNYR